MKLFSSLYQRVLRWSAHKHAPWYLGGLSFAESSFFPIPPDVMLIPMVMARADKAWFLALLTTLCSVTGGAFGFLLGWLAFDAVAPIVQSLGYWDAYLLAKSWFEEWGLWVVLLVGFSPIPYKVFTIAAGALLMPFLPFILASFLGRGGRFFLVALIMKTGGTRLEPIVRKYIDILGWLFVALLIIAFIAMKI